MALARVAAFARHSTALRLQPAAFATRSARDASTLVLADHDGEKVVSSTFNAVSAASELGGDVTLLVAGENQAVADAAAKIAGVSKVLFAKGAQFKGLVAEPVTNAILAAQEKFSFSHIVAPANSVGKNVVPRVAAKLDVAAVSDIVGIKGEDTFVRTIYAGNALQTVKSNDSVKVISARSTAFDPAAAEGGSASVEEIEVAGGEGLSEWVSAELTKSDRPDLATADRVVCGGRALKDEETFFKLMLPLADKIDAAVGATRAAVDAGYCPNDYQIGQTGKIIAPQLYMGFGVSGAHQHLAGMKDSKVIVCVNKDAEAPLFQVADYGLVGDLYQVIPEMMEKL